jgi:hypothetical protein
MERNIPAESNTRPQLGNMKSSTLFAPCSTTIFIGLSHLLSGD